MQTIKEVTKLDIRNEKLTKNFEESLKNETFKKVVSKLNMPKNELIKCTSKIEQTCNELENCKNCKGLFECKNSFSGHVSCPKVIDNRMYFTYLPCKYTKKIEDKETNDKLLLKVKMKDIDTKDKKQLKVIKYLDDFYDKFDLAKSMKGLYLHGNFGSGKTFLITALFNELEEKKKVDTYIIYFADALRDLKDDWENFSFKMKKYMNVDLLLIDDIGAEKVTEWGRDEVLGPILQYRMNNHKATFFTSNLTIDELEMHLSISNNGVDKVKSRRIIERIKELTKDLELISENRRK